MGLSDLNRVNRFFPALFLMSLNNNISKAKKINLICVSTIKLGLYNYYSATTVNYIMRRFNELDYGLKYEQIGYLKEIIEEIDQEELTSMKLSDILNVKPQSITKALHRFYADKKMIGRPRKLTEEQELQIIQKINEAFNNHDSLTPKEILEFCRVQLNEDFTEGWLQKFIARHQNEIQRDISYPQEDLRLYITIEQCQKYLEVLKNEVDGKYAELIYNADEVGCSQWMDKKCKKVIVPLQSDNNRITHKVKRASKLQTILGCISAAGDVLTPVLISTRKTIDPEVYSQGLRNDTDIIIRYSETGYATKDIFQEWITKKFIPFVNATRIELKLENEDGILLCDNCTSHISDNIKQILAQNRIKLISFPPHSSHLFQMLDLVTFGIMKHAKSTIKTPFDRGTQADVIYRDLKAFEIATISSNNRAGFLKVGFFYDTSVNPYKLKINESKVIEIMDNANLISEEQFQELFPRARRKEFGFINKQFF